MLHKGYYLSLVIPNFPVQAAIVWRKDLVHNPFVIVRQKTNNDRTVVIAASPQAAQLNIHPGMPVQKVKMQYKAVIVLKENTRLREQIKKELWKLCENYSPDITVHEHCSGITLNLSGMRRFYSTRYNNLERQIQLEIKRKIGLSEVSVSSGTSAFISLLCAKSIEPDTVKKCEPGLESLLLAELEIQLLPKLSKKTKARLQNLNLHKIGQIQLLSKNFLISRLGKEGEYLYYLIRGVEFSKMQKSVQQRILTGITFPVNSNEQLKLEAGIQTITDQLTFQLRQNKQLTNSITLILTYSDNKTVQQTHRYAVAINGFPRLFQTALTLFIECRVRRVSIQKVELLSGKLYPDNGQLELLESDRDKKEKRIGQFLDRIRNKFGFKAITNAKSMITSSEL